MLNKSLTDLFKSLNDGGAITTETLKMHSEILKKQEMKTNKIFDALKNERKLIARLAFPPLVSPKHNIFLSSAP